MTPAEMSKVRHAQFRWRVASDLAADQPTREQTEADRQTFLDAVADYRQAGIVIEVAQ